MMRGRGFVKFKSVPLIACLTAVGLLLIMLPSQLNAQVTIEERMELKKNAQGDGDILDIDDGIDDPPELEPQQPLYWMDDYRFLVLQDGHFTIRINSGYGYGSDTLEDDSLTVTVFGADSTTTTTTIPVMPYLGEPLTYSNVTDMSACRETTFRYGPDQMVQHEVVLGHNNGQRKVAYVQNSSPSYGDNFDNTNYGSGSDPILISDTLQTSRKDADGDGVVEQNELVEQRIERRTYLEFDLSGYQTNGDFALGRFHINQQAQSPSNLFQFDSVHTFSVSRVTSSWDEHAITWNNSPPGESPRLLTDQDRGNISTYFRGARFTVNITDMISSWLDSPAGNHGLVIAPEEPNTAVNFISTFTPNSGLAAAPGLSLIFSNPNPPPEQNTVSIGTLQAGDIISLQYSGVSNDEIELDPDRDFTPLSNGGGLPPEAPGMASTNSATQSAFIQFNQISGDCGRHTLNTTALFTPDNPQDSAWVALNPDSTAIAPGDTVQFLPRLAFSNGNVRPFPELQLYNVEITGGDSLGTLFASSEPDTADRLELVNKGFSFIASDSIGSAAVSPISFISVDTRLGRVGSGGGGIIVIGEAPGSAPGQQAEPAGTTMPPAVFGPDGQLNGTGQVVIVKQDTTLEITEELAPELWPYLPDQNNNGDSRGDNRPGYNPTDSTLTVLVKHGGEPMENTSVVIRAEYQAGTGGHLHTNPLPMEDQGTFWGQGENGNPITLTTNSVGIVRIDSFRTSQISGEYIIRAFLEADSTIQDSLELEVRVPDLEDFADVESNGKWSLTGDREGVHESNHWATSKAIDSISAALEDFYEWSKTETRGGKAIPLEVNDISLIWGGSYEYKGDWNLNFSHSFHRIGLSVDIDRNIILNGELITLTVREIKKLTDIMKFYGAEKYDEEPVHYGFDGGN